MADVESDPWIFSSKSLPSDNRLMATMANGYLGTRAYGEILHVNGIYNGSVGDCHRANVPSPLNVCLCVNKEEVVDERFCLDVKTGTFSHTLQCSTFTATQRLFAHRSLSHLLVNMITLRGSSPVSVNLEVDFKAESEDLDLQRGPDYCNAKYIYGSTQTPEVPSCPLKTVHMIYTPVPQCLALSSEQEKTWVFLAAVSETEKDVKERFDEGLFLADEGHLFSSHAKAWAQIWEGSRMEVEGSLVLQQAVIGCLYYLLSSLPPLGCNKDFSGISPGGLSNGQRNEDYWGHVFWDQDTWIYPNILLFYPEMARHILKYRIRTLEGALQNAKQQGYKRGVLITPSNVDREALAAALNPCWGITYAADIVVVAHHNTTRGSVPASAPVSTEDVYEVKNILDMKKIRSKTFLLVDCKGYGPEERSWELAENINPFNTLPFFTFLTLAIFANLTSLYVGAKFPWESALTGYEVCPEKIYGDQEIHINGDVLMTFKQYYHMTKDVDFFSLSGGWEVVSSIADYWCSRVVWSAEEQSYHIKGVMPPDEYHSDVNNSVYTNALAQISLNFSMELAKDLQQPIPDIWNDVASKMKVPFDSKINYHPEYDGYKLGDEVKQADVVLLGYPLMFPMSQEYRRNDLQIYGTVTDPAGPAMTWLVWASIYCGWDRYEFIPQKKQLRNGVGACGAIVSMFSIGYMELKEAKMAQQQLKKCFANITDPFKIWTENADGSGAVNFLTGMGGFLQAVLFGYTGFRIAEKCLEFDPIFTDDVTALYITGVCYLGNKVNFTFSKNLITVELTSIFDFQKYALVIAFDDVTPCIPLYIGKPVSFATKAGRVQLKTS